MSEFYVLYSSVEKISILSGLCRLQGWSVGSEKYRRMFLIYSIVSCLPSAYFVGGNFYRWSVTFTFTFDTFRTREIGVTSTHLLILFESAYFLARRDRILSLMKAFHTTTKHLLNNDLFKANHQSKVLRTAGKLNFILKYYSLSYVSLTILYPVYYYVNHLMFQSSELLFPDPLPVRSFPLQYEITLFIQFWVTFIGSLKLLSCCGFIFVMLFHTTQCFKVLRVMSKTIFHDIDVGNTNRQGYVLNYLRKPVDRQESYSRLHYNDGKVKLIDFEERNNRIQNDTSARIKRFKAWINVYKDILHLGNDINSVCSPIIGLFLLTSLIVGIFVILSATMEDTALNEKLAMYAFWSMYMFILLGFCYCGTLLMYESSILLEDVYNEICVCGIPEIHKYALITGERIKQPLRVSVFGSEYFDLTVDTFLWMVKSMASLYISFAQIKKMN